MEAEVRRTVQANGRKATRGTHFKIYLEERTEQIYRYFVNEITVICLMNKANYIYREDDVRMNCRTNIHIVHPFRFDFE